MTGQASIAAALAPGLPPAPPPPPPPAPSATRVQSRWLLRTARPPQVMTQAVVAAEARHFYTEGGISIPGIFRAAYQDLFGSGGLQGGSTITEQYAKNSYASIGTSQSITTKIKEIFVAIKLAHARSKSWIMTQ